MIDRPGTGIDARLDPQAAIGEADLTLDALRDAYRFITQPQVMSTPINGARTVTYRLGDYNGLTAKLRKAIAKVEGR